MITVGVPQSTRHKVLITGYSTAYTDRRIRYDD